MNIQSGVADWYQDGALEWESILSLAMTIHQNAMQRRRCTIY